MIPDLPMLAKFALAAAAFVVGSKIKARLGGRAVVLAEITIVFRLGCLDGQRRIGRILCPALVIVGWTGVTQ
jgi:hypothetical protein